MRHPAPMMRTLAIVAGLLVAGAAHAEGPGVKLGESLVLHPGIAVGAGYDSNVFYSSGNAGDPTTGAAYLSVRPTIDLATNPPQRGGETPHTLDFRLHLGSDMRFLLSSDPNVNDHYGINLDGGALVSLFPFGNYTFDLFDNYIRTSQTPYSQVFSSSNINSDQNQLGLRFRARPGGQRLEIGFQYIFGFYLFENDLYRSRNDLTNDFQLRVSWKFFPKTALYLQASEQTNTYIVQAADTPPSAYPFRVVLGVMGLITTKLSVNVNVGYGNSFTQANAAYPNTSSYNSVIALVEGTWKPTLLTNVVLGYKHDLVQALIGTYYTLDTAYASLAQQIWRLTGLIRFGWERRQYAGDLTPSGLANNDMNPRVDNLLALHIQIDFPIKDWLYLSVGDDLQKNFTNCQLLSTGGIAAVPCDYFRNDVWVRLGVAY